MSPALNEKQRRRLGATLAETFGYGGATVVHKETGLAMNTISSGKNDLREILDKDSGRVRAIGGGPKFTEFYHPDIKVIIRKFIEDSSYGDPNKTMIWTNVSLRKIAAKLFSEYGIKLHHTTVGSIVEGLGYNLHANAKMLQNGKPHPDRNAQFEFINAKATEFIEIGEPVISVDTKKKELIGNFKNNGREYRKIGDARKVLDHDFPISELGKVAPYGIYNLNNNTGFVNLGTSHDTAEFAVESISRWWDCVGKNTFPNATKLFVTCDCGGSNGYRLKLWKYQLFQLAKKIGLDIHVSHFPQGTSKWNKVEHRLFCFISKNWQGKPLIDIQTVINLISSTTTKNNLSVICVRDDNVYELSKKVSNDDFNSIPLVKIPPFGDWNYIIQVSRSHHTQYTDHDNK
ncbi:MAG: ISAzo13 family transposase [Deltaproteobacteria bacterium]|nr:ISAzo13 family transposase [Deltaproteobacteria bacterium]